jgi:SAM-dependent methyltransferase
VFVADRDDLARLLDEFLDDRHEFWDGFYADRAKPCPFFVDEPDESLVELCGWLPPGRALELGCGNGRNAAFLARRGWRVDAVDASSTALAWARERCAGLDVRFQQRSIFDADVEPGAHDLVYDSGMLHHLPPHRRPDHVALVDRALAPGGHLGLVCFRPEGGSGLTDRQVYEQRTLGGGLGFDETGLRALWDRPPFALRGLRPMRSGGEHFGEDFLWAVLAEKQGG